MFRMAESEKNITVKLYLTDNFDSIKENTKREAQDEN